MFKLTVACREQAEWLCVRLERQAARQDGLMDLFLRTVT